MKHRGFTLVELLICILIICILAAITYPVYTHAKVQGKKATSISNMRQCVLALNIYSDENDSTYPEREQAIALLKNDLTWDPMDYWRTSSKVDWPPLVGSYGYAAYDSIRAAINHSRQLDGRRVPVLVSVFYSTPRLAPLHGEYYPDDVYKQCKEDTQMPKQALVAYGDGSVKQENVLNADKLQMSWPALFSQLTSQALNR